MKYDIFTSIWRVVVPHKFASSPLYAFKCPTYVHISVRMEKQRKNALAWLFFSYLMTTILCMIVVRRDTFIKKRVQQHSCIPLSNKLLQKQQPKYSCFYQQARNNVFKNFAPLNAQNLKSGSIISSDPQKWVKNNHIYFATKTTKTIFCAIIIIIIVSARLKN